MLLGVAFGGRLIARDPGRNLLGVRELGNRVGLDCCSFRCAFASRFGGLVLDLGDDDGFLGFGHRRGVSRLRAVSVLERERLMCG